MRQAGICRATAERRLWRYIYGFCSYEDMFVRHLRLNNVEREAEDRLLTQQYRQKHLKSPAEKRKIDKIFESLDADAQDIGASKYKQNLRWELRGEENGGAVIEQIYGMPTPREVYRLCMAGEPGAGHAILNDDDELTAYQNVRGENVWRVIFSRAAKKRARERDKREAA